MPQKETNKFYTAKLKLLHQMYTYENTCIETLRWLSRFDDEKNFPLITFFNCRLIVKYIVVTEQKLAI